MERIFQKLDEYFEKNDMAGAERHLLFWLAEKKDTPAAIPLLNELLGVYRKTGRSEEALSVSEEALSLIRRHRLEGTESDATTHLNTGTLFSATGNAKEALSHFEKAKAIYEMTLTKDDGRLSGLYNNMAIALVAEERYPEAYALYEKAIALLKNKSDGALHIAVTKLNIADAKEKELGAEAAEGEIEALLGASRKLLEDYPVRDGYYAFVCEKCASVFGYYGHFLYAKELKERADTIYART